MTNLEEKIKLKEGQYLLNDIERANLIYEIVGSLSDNQIKEINAINTHSKIQDRIKRIKSFGCNLEFNEVENDIFQANFQMVDTMLPEILAEYILLYFSGKGSKISELTPLVRQINPCKFDISSKQKFYEHKVKTFLTDCALGMTAANPWNGRFQATGGYIVVRDDGEVLCYHIYNRNAFRDYLFKNTRFETPSTSRYDFGYIYEKDGKNYIKLNLQVRFI